MLLYISIKVINLANIFMYWTHPRVKTVKNNATIMIKGLFSFFCSL